MNGRILAAALLMAGVALAADDVVRPKNGPELKGKITRLEIDGLTIEAGGATKTLRVEEVAGFTLGDTPKKQMEAEAAMSARDYDRAIAAYTSALGELKPGRGDIHRQFIYQGLLRALKAKGDDAAADTVLKFLKECPKAWNYAEVAREGIETAKAKGNDAKAREIVNAMRAAADPMKGFGAIEYARMQIASKDYSGAQSTLSAIVGNKNQPYATEAQVWMIRALRGKKDTSSLEPMCRGILGAKDAAAALVQTAASGLGDALMEKAKGGDKAALREAMVAYAQAIAIGPPAKDQPPDDYASALLHLAKCYILAGQGAGKEGAPENAKSRAMGYLAEVVGKYPRTEWSAAAEKELAALGVGGGSSDGEQKQ